MSTAMQMMRMMLAEMRMMTWRKMSIFISRSLCHRSDANQYCWLFIIITGYHCWPIKPLFYLHERLEFNTFSRKFQLVSSSFSFFCHRCQHPHHLGSKFIYQNCCHRHHWIYLMRVVSDHFARAILITSSWSAVSFQLRSNPILLPKHLVDPFCQFVSFDLRDKNRHHHNIAIIIRWLPSDFRLSWSKWSSSNNIK